MTTKQQGFGLLCAAILGMTLLIHLIFIPLTSWESDEGVYLNITRSITTNGFPALNLHQGELVWFSYQPPFHFYLMHLWGSVFGMTIESMRALSAVIATVFVGATMWFTREVTRDEKVAVLAGAGLMIAGWFTYSSGFIKIDTASALIGVVGLTLFVKAYRSGQISLATIAGIVLGGAAAYKHVGVYVLGAVILHWLFVRDQHPIHRRVIFMIAAVLAVYVVGMSLSVGQVYIDATETQIRRATGLQQARGLDYGIDKLFEALIRTYWAFGGSILVLVSASVVAIYKGWRHFWYREDLVMAPLTAAVLAGVIALAAVRLRNPHYLVFAEWSATAYLAMLLIRMRGTRDVLSRRAVFAIIVLHAVTILIRGFVFSQSNALQMMDVVLKSLPENAVILSEEGVCALAQQECHAFDTTTDAELASTAPTIVIVQETITLQAPKTAAVQALLDAYVEQPELTRSDWKGTFTVLRRP